MELDFITCQKIINEELGKLSLDKEPSELFEPIKYVLSLGGKRLRPALVLLCNNLYTEDYNKALSPALGIEVFHNFTLLHDDIMDNASIRRNSLTVHEKWNRNIALLSGDAMLIKSYELISKYESEKSNEIIKVFNKTALEVCEGQQYDMNFEYSFDVSISDYLNMISLKTAALIAASTKIGALLGGADNNDAAYLYEFGKNIGMGFQLQDDL